MWNTDRRHIEACDVIDFHDQNRVCSASLEAPVFLILLCIWFIFFVWETYILMSLWFKMSSAVPTSTFNHKKYWKDVFRDIYLLLVFWLLFILDSKKNGKFSELYNASLLLCIGNISLFLCVTSKTQCEEFGSLIGRQDYVTLSIPVFSLRWSTNIW